MQFSQLKRRKFITFLGGAAAWPLAVRAQQHAMPVIGFLGAASMSGWSAWTSAFVQRLHELGWIEGKTVRIEYRWAEGRTSRFIELAHELVGLSVNVIVTSGAAWTSAKQTTSVIPVVLAVAGDPVGDGLVDSLARPGRNVTGLSIQTVDTSTKRLQLLRDIVPTLRRVTILANATYPVALREMDEAEKAARTFSFDTVNVKIQPNEDFGDTLAAISSNSDALYVCTDPLVNSNRFRISALTLGARLPTTWGFREAVETGALMSYGASYTDLFRRAADYVNKVLHGANPADLPVEQPTKFELVINVKTAKALGLTVPSTLLAIADEVIE